MSLYRFAFIFPVRFIASFLRCLVFSLGKCRWYPLSLRWLQKLDKKTRALLKHQNSSQFVTVHVNHQDIKIWTVHVSSDNKNVSAVPIVLIHNIMGGGNLYLNNIDEFAKHRDVYLLDLPGWGFSGQASIRVKLEDGWWVKSEPEDVEMFYTNCLKAWLDKVNLDRVILLGHGFGSYVSSVFSMVYPQHVAHLVLVEPWGHQRRPNSADDRPFMANAPINLVSQLYGKALIFTPIRALGPFALPLYRIFRLGLKEKFMALWNGLDPQQTSLDRIKELMMGEREEYFPDMTMQDYSYLWMMHSKNGEIALDILSIPFGWARLPLEERLDDLDADLDMTFIFGSKSWVRSGCAWQTKHHRHDSYVEVHEIGGAGHLVFADRPLAFNSIVNLIGEAVDKGLKPNITEDFKQRSKAMARLRRQVSSSLLLAAEEAIRQSLMEEGAEGEVLVEEEDEDWCGREGQWDEECMSEGGLGLEEDVDVESSGDDVSTEKVLFTLG